MVAPLSPHSNKIDPQELKRTTYNILKKLHDLERGRKVSRIYNVQCHNEPCILVCLRNLRDSLSTALQADGSTLNSAPAKRFFTLLDQTIELISRNARTNSKIDRGYIPELLSSHSYLFNYIVSRQVKVDLNFDNWSSFVIPAVRVWKNQV
jgi:hypothetical protein